MATDQRYRTHHSTLARKLDRWRGSGARTPMLCRMRLRDGQIDLNSSVLHNVRNGCVVLPYLDEPIAIRAAMDLGRAAGTTAVLFELVSPTIAANATLAELAARLVLATRRLRVEHGGPRGMRLGYFAQGVAAGVTLLAAGELGPDAGAIIALDGRFEDVSASHLAAIAAPTLFIVRAGDPALEAQAIRARRAMRFQSELCIVPAGLCDEAACVEAMAMSQRWLRRHLRERRTMWSETFRLRKSLRPAQIVRRTTGAFCEVGRRSPVAPSHIAVLLTALAALAGGEHLRAALTSSFAGGVLTITGDAASDTMAVDCSGGITRVNGVNVTGNPPCNAVTQITINAGDGHDVIDLTAVTAVAFPNITGTTLLGGPGLDIIRGTPFADNINGGSSNDILEGFDGNDTLTGGPGDLGAGGDRVEASADADFIITNNTMSGLGIDLLDSIETVQVFGGPGANSIDASAFTGRGGAFLVGLAGNDTIRGTAFNDGIIGDVGDDSIVAGAGEDLIFENIGDDTIDGGPGSADQLYEGAADEDQILTDTSLSAPGNNVITGLERVQLIGGAGGNLLDASGFSGTVGLFGQGGNDTLLGTAGADLLDGSTGNDSYVGGGGNDSLDDGGGDDTFVGGAGEDSLLEVAVDVDQTLTNTSLTGPGTNALTSVERVHLRGLTGANTLNASAFTLGSVTLTGGDGNDTLIGTALGDSLTGGAGNDSLVGGDGIDGAAEFGDANFTLTNAAITSGLGIDSLSGIEFLTITGGPGNNTIDASAFSLGGVSLLGEDGNDTLIGTAFDDTLSGGRGHDWLTAGSGDDALNDLTGDDTFNGGGGVDSLTEGPTDADQVLTNTTLAGPGSNVLSDVENVSLTGGPTNNTLDASAFTFGSVTLSGAEGDDTLRGGTGTDVLSDDFTGTTTLTNTALTGVLGNDVLSGLEGASLFGDRFDDLLDGSGFTGPITVFAGGGNDTVLGGSGNDWLVGQGGDDSLVGGGGIDTVGGEDSSFTLANTLLTGIGTDTLASVESASLLGSADDDLIDASAFTAGGVTLDGDAGNDTLLGGSRNDVIDGGTGDDSVAGDGGDDTFITTASATTSIDGGIGIDTVHFDSEGATATITGTGIAVGANIKVLFADPPEQIFLNGVAQPHRYLLAEGATGAFFDLDIAIGNPNAVAVPTTITFLKADGTTVPLLFTLANQARTTIRADDVPGLGNTAVSAVVSSNNGLPLLVERTMFWDPSHYGGHTGNAVEGARTQWYFGGGLAGLLRHLRAAGQRQAVPPVNATRDVPARKRRSGRPQRTVPATSRRERLGGRDSGARQSVVQHHRRCQRTDRRGARDVFRHPALQRRARIARRSGRQRPAGSTPRARPGRYFDTFILVGNPNVVPANVTFKFLLSTGATVTRIKQIPANTRLTLNVELEDRGPGGCRGVDDGHVGCAGHLRAGDVLARDRSISGSKRTIASGRRRSRPSGGWRRAVSAVRSRSRPTSCWPTRMRPRPRPCSSRSCGHRARRL